eukprot:g982.t1
MMYGFKLPSLAQGGGRSIAVVQDHIEQKDNVPGSRRVEEDVPFKVDKIFIIAMEDHEYAFVRHGLKERCPFLHQTQDIENFPAIDTRGDRWKNYRDMISEYQLTQMQNALKTGKRKFHSDCTPGAIGCFLSHYNVWKKAIEEDLDHVFILEANNMSEEPTTSIDASVKQFFDTYDVNNNQTICRKELNMIFVKRGFQVSDDSIDLIFNSCTDDKGEITSKSLTEFVINPPVGDPHLAFLRDPGFYVHTFLTYAGIIGVVMVYLHHWNAIGQRGFLILATAFFASIVLGSLGPIIVDIKSRIENNQQLMSKVYNFIDRVKSTKCVHIGHLNEEGDTDMSPVVCQEKKQGSLAILSKFFQSEEIFVPLQVHELKGKNNRSSMIAHNCFLEENLCRLRELSLPDLRVAMEKLGIFANADVLSHIFRDTKGKDGLISEERFQCFLAEPKKANVVVAVLTNPTAYALLLFFVAIILLFSEEDIPFTRQLLSLIAYPFILVATVLMPYNAAQVANQSAQREYDNIMSFCVAVKSMSKESSNSSLSKHDNIHFSSDDKDHTDNVKENISSFFRCADMDGDGFINCRELKFAVCQMQDLLVTDEVINCVFNHCDKDITNKDEIDEKSLENFLMTPPFVPNWYLVLTNPVMYCQLCFTIGSIMAIVHLSICLTNEKNVCQSEGQFIIWNVFHALLLIGVIGFLLQVIFEKISATQRISTKVEQFVLDIRSQDRISIANI